MSDRPILSSQETMPPTSVVFSSILGPSCSGQGQPGMGERGGGAGGSGDLIFQDGRLISGSLEALMEHLVPTVDYYPDVSACCPAGTATEGGRAGEGGRVRVDGAAGAAQGSPEPCPPLPCSPAPPISAPAAPRRVGGGPRGEEEAQGQAGAAGFRGGSSQHGACL